jgi:hypothetical protein
MATKKKNLAAALHEAADPKEEAATPVQASSARSAGREGKKAVTGFFDPAVSKQLKQIALEEDSSLQALLQEAINDLFAKRGKSQIA